MNCSPKSRGPQTIQSGFPASIKWASFFHLGNFCSTLIFFSLWECHTPGLFLFHLGTPFFHLGNFVHLRFLFSNLAHPFPPFFSPLGAAYSFKRRAYCPRSPSCSPPVPRVVFGSLPRPLSLAVFFLFCRKLWKPSGSLPRLPVVFA